MAKLGRKLRRWNAGTRETVRVELPALPEFGFDEPEWVDLKKVLGRDDERRRRELSLRALKMRGGDSLQAEGDLASLVVDAEIAVLAVAIVAWSFDEKIDMDSIALLEQKWIDLLKEQCNELYPAPMTEDEVKNSDGG